MSVGSGISLPQSTSVRNCIQVGHPSRCLLRRPGPCCGRPGTALPAEASPTPCHSQHRRPAVVPPPRSPLRRHGRVLVVTEPHFPLKRRPHHVDRSTVARAASVGRTLFHVAQKEIDDTVSPLTWSFGGLNQAGAWFHRVTRCLLVGKAGECSITRFGLCNHPAEETVVIPDDPMPLAEVHSAIEQAKTFCRAFFNSRLIPSESLTTGQSCPEKGRSVVGSSRVITCAGTIIFKPSVVDKYLCQGLCLDSTSDIQFSLPAGVWALTSASNFSMGILASVMTPCVAA